ncbi:hypothetical protein AWZ03_003745 [Drosophila navojoa]|uniref:Uncharacterized protein n=1 Tax=Drosophila navojoa TaxID=7232 RepID=A0A484BLU4_DRONA|nr:hypothetical protein AWZ03_003745 [Drosophila navojoa]
MQNQNQKAAQVQQRTRLRYRAKDAFVDDGGMPPKISQGAGATAEADDDDDDADADRGGGGALLFKSLAKTLTRRAKGAAVNAKPPTRQPTPSTALAEHLHRPQHPTRPG